MNLFEAILKAEDMIQCVLKVKYENDKLYYLGMILDNTDYENDEEMELDFQERLQELPENENFLIAYHEEGKREFYDKEGSPIDLDFTEDDEFHDAYEKAIKENPIVPFN